MSLALQSLPMFGGLGCQRVIEIKQNSDDDLKQLSDKYFGDVHWDCKARNQPFMCMKGEATKRYRDHGARKYTS